MSRPTLSCTCLLRHQQLRFASSSSSSSSPNYSAPAQSQRPAPRRDAGPPTTSRGPPPPRPGPRPAYTPRPPNGNGQYYSRPPTSAPSRNPYASRSPASMGPEDLRREEVRQARLNVGLNPAKQFAQERERERERSIRLPSTRSPAPSGRMDARPDDSRFASRRPGIGTGRTTDRSGIREQRMVAGMVNRSTRQEAPVARGVQPVVRGSVVRGSPSRKRNTPQVLKKVALPSTMRLENLTNLLGVKLWRLQKAMTRIGLENTDPGRLLTAEDASLVALELNFDPTIDDEAAFDVYPSPPSLTPHLLPLRPPITGIFGHVDHGKTSLLDRLRQANVASGEAGGITQHIGAFEVPVSTLVANLRAGSDGEVSADEGAGTITFLDTPGHAAFTAMRERGAGVTDVVVLVVAADDGVKPQTEEVIGLIKTADVGVVVAITKCDKLGVDTLKVKQGLMAAGVEVEAFGGDVPCVEISSVTGAGFPELLETISAIAEFRELKAEREGRVEGMVIESRVEKGRGNVATVLVLRGCLRPTASLVAGTTWCRVRSLFPSSGAPVTAAYPGQPVEVTGWKELPSAGDVVLEAKSEDEAKKAVANRMKRIEQTKMWEDVEVINEKRRMDSEIEAVRREEEARAKAGGAKGKAIIAAGDAAVEGMEGRVGVGLIKELVLIIKADVSGTVEAVVGALEGIGNSEAKVKIIHSAVGDVSESDVEMARAVEGSIVGFNVKAPNSVMKSAARPPYAVPIHVSPIIYRLVDTIRAAVADLLPKTTETRVHGEALVQQVFEITIKGRKDPKRVAGCKVGNGVFQKGRKARVVRGGETIHTGTVETLKQVKKDVLEITKGVECGISLDGFDDFLPDDIIQSIEETEVSRTL